MGCFGLFNSKTKTEKDKQIDNAVASTKKPFGTREQMVATSSPRPPKPASAANLAKQTTVASKPSAKKAQPVNYFSPILPQSTDAWKRYLLSTSLASSASRIDTRKQDVQ